MTSRRIVLVEDDEGIRAIARMALEKIGGHRVLAFGSGAKAAAEAAAFSPDLFVLDVSMPDMDGPQTLAALRRQAGLEAVPAVFLTALTGAQDVGRYRGLGAVDVIAKPFYPEELSGRIDAVFAAAAASAPSPAAPLRPTVLVVEDDAAIRYLLGFILEQQGYTMLTAADGHAGLQAIADGPRTDLVILDFMLPGIDGLELLKRLRALERWAGSRVVMVTSKGDESSVSAALAAGADDYLGKPFDPADLIARLQRLQRAGSPSGAVAA